MACRDALQSKAIQAERRSPATDTGPVLPPRSTPRLPPHLPLSSSSHQHPGPPTLLVGATALCSPQRNRQLVTAQPGRPSGVLSCQPHPPGLACEVPAQEIIHLKKHTDPVAALGMALGRSLSPILCIPPTGNSPAELQFSQKSLRNNRKPEQGAHHPH